MRTWSAQIPVRDGTGLETCFFLPECERRVPALVCRTVYRIEDVQQKAAVRFVEAGFAVVLQHVRGRGASEGVLDGGELGGEDGYDTIAWVAAQPWCDGKIGTFGASALALAQLSAATLGHPAHRAMAPHALPFGMNRHCGGAFLYSQLPVWLYHTQSGADLRPFEGIAWERHLARLPLASALDELGGAKDLYRERLLRPPIECFGVPGQDGLEALDVPALLVTGWYDHCLTGPLDLYAAIRKVGIARQRENTHLVIGPWDHSTRRQDFHEYDFGPQSDRDHLAAEIDFFSRHLKGDLARSRPAAVRIFVMGRNCWRDEPDWPPPRATVTRFYLHGDGTCNGIERAGQLSMVPPGNQPPETFVYDPCDPVPTVGGNNPGPACAMPMKRGPRDQRSVLRRKDVCVFFSERLREPLEVTGPLRMVLFASSSAPDTDFTAKLFAVAPDGTCMGLQDGIVRARFRHGPARTEFLTPGRVERFEIDLWATSYEFQAGHRIGLAISSSNFPRFSRNLNTGGDNEADDRFVAAWQTVFHERKYPSHVVLPVVAGSDR